MRLFLCCLLVISLNAESFDAQKLNYIIKNTLSIESLTFENYLKYWKAPFFKVDTQATNEVTIESKYGQSVGKVSNGSFAMGAYGFIYGLKVIQAVTQNSQKFSYNANILSFNHEFRGHRVMLGYTYYNEPNIETINGKPVLAASNDGIRLINTPGGYQHNRITATYQKERFLFGTSNEFSANALVNAFTRYKLKTTFGDFLPYANYFNDNNQFEFGSSYTFKDKSRLTVSGAIYFSDFKQSGIKKVEYYRRLFRFNNNYNLPFDIKLNYYNSPLAQHKFGGVIIAGYSALRFSYGYNNSYAIENTGVSDRYTFRAFLILPIKLIHLQEGHYLSDYADRYQKALKIK